MPNSLQVASLRGALRILPVKWVLWSLDADGVLLVHEGPALPRAPLGCAVGRSVWEVYGGEEPIVSFAGRVLREPAAAELVSGGVRFHIAGSPVPGGGALGVALVLGRAAAAEGERGAVSLPAVVELLRPVAEIGADAGDLLLWNPDRPEAVGFYREIPTSRLPPDVARDLRLTRSSDASSDPPASAGAARPLRERASHLRVVS